MKGLSPQVIAVLLSTLVYPGTGQFYNRQIGKGVVLLVGFTASSILFAVEVWQKLLAPLMGMYGGLTTNPEHAPMNVSLNVPGLIWLGVFLLLIILFYIAVAVDAFFGAARRAQQQQQPQPQPQTTPQES